MLGRGAEPTPKVDGGQFGAQLGISTGVSGSTFAALGTARWQRVVRRRVKRAPLRLLI